MIKHYNHENPNNKLTYSAVFIKAAGEGLAYSSQVYGKISFGAFVPSPSVNLGLVVNLEGENLTGVVVKDTGYKSIREINNFLKAQVREAKVGRQKLINNFVKNGKHIPSFLGQLLFRVMTWVCHDFGFKLRILGIEPENFSWGGLINLTTFDIHDAYPPLIPGMMTVFTAAMNTPHLRPVVVDGNLAIRKIMNMNMTFDHRFADGSEAAKVVQVIQKVLENPTKFL